MRGRLLSSRKILFYLVSLFTPKTFAFIFRHINNKKQQQSLKLSSPAFDVTQSAYTNTHQGNGIAKNGTQLNFFFCLFFNFSFFHSISLPRTLNFSIRAHPQNDFDSECFYIFLPLILCR